MTETVVLNSEQKNISDHPAAFKPGKTKIDSF